MAGQVAPVHRVDGEIYPSRVEAAVALEDQGGMVVIMMVVTAVRVFTRQYLVPPIIMAVAVAAAPATLARREAPLAMEDWVAVGQEVGAGQEAEHTYPVIRVQPSQGAEVVAVALILMGVQAAPASSSSATRRKPPARRR